MSFSPSLSLAKLKDLQEWQGSYENLLKARSKPQISNPKSIENSQNSSIHSVEKFISLQDNWDLKKISPTKPFEQLLEEKLAEDSPIVMDKKPKKPFLRKGQGLARYKMGPMRSVSATQNDRTTSKKQGTSSKGVLPARNNKTVPDRKGILKNPLYYQDIDLKPLIVPDFVKPRGTWRQVFENDVDIVCKNGNPIEEDRESLENYEDFRKSIGSGEGNVPLHGDEYTIKNTSSEHALGRGTGSEIQIEEKRTASIQPKLSALNHEVLEKIDVFSKNYPGAQNAFIRNNIPSHIFQVQTSKPSKTLDEDVSLETQRMERDLKIFETLEKKVDNSSFCSTNTSIVELMTSAGASTPQKNKKETITPKIIREEKEEEEDYSGIGIIEESLFNGIPKNVQEQIREVSRKTDVLQQFLLNLQNMQRTNYLLTSSVNDKQMDSTNHSFSDVNTQWSSRSPSSIDNYTDCETTCQSDPKTVNRAVNTSFDSLTLDATVRGYEGECQECEQIRVQISNIKSKMSEVKVENFRLKSELRDVLNDFDNVKTSMKEEAENYKRQLEKIESELNTERKKFLKERTYFETYVKDIQNRPSKKEREEITNLKQELADIKELVKLKDTKNGATQARLRTQLKQQEKELIELKEAIEKLQKEKAKLTASQKYVRRPQEVKMLHEINKNLTKLTEKTFEKQMNKSGNGDEVNDSRKKENDNTVKNKDTSKISNKSYKDSFLSDNTLQEIDGVDIEQQYENTFRNGSSPRNTSHSTSTEKTERALPDGSIEILYSNGNLKTISADGKIVNMKYCNGDVKETNLNEKIIKYHYAAVGSWHTQFSDGTEVMEFADGHKCTKFQDGKTEVSYADGSFRVINADGTEEQTFPDGRKTLKNLQGEQIILLPNGQREIHTSEYKRREYPDGTLRTLHKDGSVETVYANGRVRLKDPNGILIMDTHQN
ncbi:hypothetical protein ABEB36_006653 [Hypothenemus hampei]|uniref:Centromere protein J n=1 Tax=Hypothenemus hampei TaxID=57062 RepID=A0ABD1ERA3_HYPHA